MDVESLTKHFHFSRPEDLLLSLGRMDISSTQIEQLLRPVQKGPTPDHPSSKPARKRTPSRNNDPEITIQGIHNLVTHRAQCCQPQPGDPIIGFVTLTRGIAIHRQDCINILGLQGSRQNRLLNVQWGSEELIVRANLEIIALNRRGIIKEITHLIAENGLEILRIRSKPDASKRNLHIHALVTGDSLGIISRTVGEALEMPEIYEIRQEPASLTT